MTTALDLVSIDYSFWMKQALSLATRGLGYTQPNPMVGAIVLDATGTMVGQGFHATSGQPHAETIALTEAGSFARGGTLVVSLEPCCHQGRTPPCTEAIIAAGIERVISAGPDPDSRVAGRGFSRLKEAGLELITGIEVEQAERLNRHYFCHRRTGRPWVTLKLAMSMDGRTADAFGHSQWITSSECRRHGHRLRSLHDAILVGAETARRDNPQLSLHEQPGLEPKRFVLQGSTPLPRSLKLFSGMNPATTIGVDDQSDWSVAQDERGLPDLLPALERMGAEGLTALLVEGGGKTVASFLKAGLVRRIVAYYAPLFLGEGSSALSDLAFPLASALQLSDVEHETLAGGWVVSGLVEVN